MIVKGSVEEGAGVINGEKERKGRIIGRTKEV